MGYTIPNAPDASVIDQSEPDSGDFVALGNRKSGVVSGCVVTANTVNDQTVLVSAGEVVSNGTYYTITSTSLSMGTGTAGSARFDLVVVDSIGTIVKRQGTAGSNPTFPALTDGDVLLAAVYRAAGTSDVISSTRIVDKAILTPSNTVRTGSGAPAGSLGSIGDIYVNTALSSNAGQSQIYVKMASTSWENIAEYIPMSSSNVASNIVQRDSNGDFAARNITASLVTSAVSGTVTGSLVGNASTASAFSNSRTVSLSGDVTATSSATDGNHSLTTTIGNAKIKNAMIDYTSVPQTFINNGSSTPTGKDGDIWIVV